MAKNGKNGNGKKEKVNGIVERLEKSKENESLIMKASEQLEDGYTAEIGYYKSKNGKNGSYQIKLKYGLTGLLKIRNKTEFEQIKKLIDFLSKNPEYVDAVERLNGGKPRKTVKSVEYI